jgi:GTPase SAR1 family protein
MLDYNMVYKFWFYLPFYPFVLNPTTIIFYLHFVCIELDIAKHVHTFISDFLFKFLVIGSAGTGKSCILHQFI